MAYVVDTDCHPANTEQQYGKGEKIACFAKTLQEVPTSLSFLFKRQGPKGVLFE